MTKTLQDYTKDELIDIIKGLKRRKKFGLVWEGKPEEVVRLCEANLPVIEEVPDRAIHQVKDAPTSFIIEGDNYHSLSVLNYTHTGKIDVIYIDPPYNTGASDWKYNNNYIDGNDTYQHSKWLSFMDKRMRLAKNLLKSTGIVVVTIDDYEVATLTLLMNEIYGSENHLGTVVIRNNPSGRSTVKGFSVNHEYALFYSISSKAVIGRLPHNQDQIKRYNEKDDNGYYEWENFRKNGTDSDKLDRPKQFYPIVINTLTHKLRVPRIEWDIIQRSYEFQDSLSSDEKVVLPIKNGIEKVWKYGLERLTKITDELMVKNTKDGYEIYRKKYLNDIGSLPRTWWDKPSYSARDNGTRKLAEVLGSKNTFDFPKAPEAVQDCIRVANLPKDGIVLDFFAGSGTAGQAVLEMNKEDGGKRQFILCTNNENGIAENVTYARVKNVIDGYSKYEGIKSNLRYFKTSLVSKQQTDDQTRMELVARSTDMICLREDTFENVIDTKQFKVFSNNYFYAAIVFDPEAIVPLKDALGKLNDSKAVHIYVFSLSNDTYESDFADLERVHELRPIPESILEVYRRIHKNQKEELSV